MNIDESWNLLSAALSSAPPQSLLVLDEQFAGGLPASENLTCITNRCDVAALVIAQGLPCVLNDFDFSVLDFSPAQIFYRISKEKVIVHHVLDSAFSVLAAGGTLTISGAKNEGIRTFVKKAALVCDAMVSEKKGNRSSWIARLRPAGRANKLLGEDSYADLQQVGGDQWPLCDTKPGIFGWNKVDAGSALLAQHLNAKFTNGTDLRVLDLGCGYGFLSIAAAAGGAGNITATDNNVAAISACKSNFKRHHINGDVVLADCGEGIEPGFDRVICNPPFHRGFGVEVSLIDRFVARAAVLLKETGSAIFVVHTAVRLDQRAGKYFAASKVLSETSQFQVLELTRPIRR